MSKTSISPPQDTIESSLHLEAQKLLFDSFKHLTTLSTGSILLLATFIKDIFKQPEWRILIAVSFFFFIVSIVSSVITMKLIAHGVIEETGNRYKTVGAIAYIVSIGGFVIGIALFAMFCFKNMP